MASAAPCIGTLRMPSFRTLRSLRTEGQHPKKKEAPVMARKRALVAVTLGSDAVSAEITPLMAVS